MPHERGFVGIVKKEVPIHNISVSDMRKEIYQAAYNSAIVRQCTRRQEIEGLSGEELMVMIAYIALIAAEDYYNIYSETTRLTP